MEVVEVVDQIGVIQAQAVEVERTLLCLILVVAEALIFNT
jgi:hypothetical protein